MRYASHFGCPENECRPIPTPHTFLPHTPLTTLEQSHESWNEKAELNAPAACSKLSPLTVV